MVKFTYDKSLAEFSARLLELNIEVEILQYERLQGSKQTLL